jgi:hypothetical protein
LNEARQKNAFATQGNGTLLLATEPAQLQMPKSSEFNTNAMPHPQKGGVGPRANSGAATEAGLIRCRPGHQIIGAAGAGLGSARSGSDDEYAKAMIMIAVSRV